MKPASLFLIILAAGALRSAAAAPLERVVLPSDAVPVRYDVSIVPNAADRTFTGTVAIALDVARPTARIVLNAVDLDLKRAALSGIAVEPKISFDSARQTATLTFPSPLPAGPRTLTIDYAGKINEHASGLFSLDYETAGGRRRALFTQFENSDARRFVPCWDEPARKAVFTLTATVPADLMAVSNTPVAASEALPNGLKRVRFQPTPKMSSYLLFFGLGDFERVSKMVDGVDVGVIVKRGDADKAGFALDAAARILPYYEEYFDAKYPLPKLDLIAGPGESQFFSAMENWGAIFYFERALLVDPKLSTRADERSIFVVVAHEMAHQWFGDLVTMDWWEDLWLNEGFASWMQMKAADRFHPEWKIWLDGLGSKEGAMRLDARRGTHPVIQPIADVLQANQAFDSITYQKGQAVIRMLEDYVGEDSFRAGVRRYIKAHAYGNTVTDDLWRELEKTSSAPVTRIAHDFTLQAGVPLIRAAATPGGVRLTQSRYAEDESGAAPASWRAPVIVSAPGGSAPWHGLVTGDAPSDVAGASGGALVVNWGQTGYFRTLYDKTAFDLVSRRFSELSPADQLGLLNDTRALGFTGQEPVGDFLALNSLAAPGLDPHVLQSIASRLAGIDTLYDGLPRQTAYEAYGRRVVAPLLIDLGWSPKPGESQNDALLRNVVLGALSQLQDPAVLAEARRLFEGYLNDPSTLTSDLRRNVLGVVAAHADAATWDRLHALALASKSSLEKRELYGLLGTARDRALAGRALALSLSDEAPVTNRPSMVRAVAGRYPDDALGFLDEHWDVFSEIIEPDSWNQFAPRLAASSNDLATIGKLRAFADKRIPKDARGEVLKAEASIAYNAKARAERLPEIDRWLDSHP